MKTKAKLIFLITILSLVATYSNAEYIYFEGKWYWCPPEPVLAAGVDVSDCLPVDEPSRDETNSGGDSGTTTPTTPDPGTGYVFIPPPLPYPDPGNSDIDYTGGDGGDETNADGSILNPGEVGDTTEPELPPLCNCKPCPKCGLCILAEGESLPAGCEDKCKHCINSFSFKCIEGVRKIVEFRKVESILWTTAMFSYNIFLIVYDPLGIMNILNQMYTEINFNVDFIEIDLTYYKGKLVSWSGDLQFICNNQIITNKYNENTIYDVEKNLTSNAKIEFFKVVSGKRTLVFHDYDKVYGNYISASQINRDGIPNIGESIYKEFKLPSL